MVWNFKEFENRIAVREDSGTVASYADLARVGEEIAEAIGKRALVFSFCTNTIGSIAGYAGFINHGIVPVLFSAHVEEELRTSLIELYNPEYLWIPKELDDALADSGEVIYSSYDYSLIKTSYGIDHPLYPELGLLLTTSGSTGSPKFVRQSYRNIEANTASIIEYLGITKDDRPITTLPMNYTYGLSIINTHLASGATILATDKTLMQKEFWALFKEGEATTFGGVPYTYEMLDKLRFFRMDLSSLRYMTQAGGKLTVELHEKFANFAKESGKKFIVMYGQSEATARMGYLPAEHALDKIGSMGIAIPGGKLILIDEDGNEIKESDVSGELVYYGDNVTLGYAEKPEDLAKGDERHGRLETGDMAKRDEDGYFYIVGRKKRFLKIFGNRVNLDEVDRLIKGHFGDVDCASAGKDDNLYIFVSGTDKAEEIRQYIIQKTGLNPVAINVVEIDKIPRNESGKTLYVELEQYYK